MASSKPKILQLGVIEHAHDAWEAISQLAEVIRPSSTDRESFIAECRSGLLDGTVIAYRTFESFKLTGRFDEELVQALPKSLRFVCHNGAGYDQLDIDACTARNILVSNTPTAVDDSTADLAIFLILGCLRNLPVSMASLRAGDWRGNPLPKLGHDPQGKILGILGMGGIGRTIAERARVFGMEVRYHNRTKLSEEMAAGAEYVDFETLLRASDVLSLSLPLNPRTRHIISHHELSLTKPGVVIVNTARGAIINESALVSALDSGHVASAGLDVYEDEPVVHPGLLRNDRVLLVPHMGTWTVETETKMEEWAFDNIRMALETGKLKSVVPEQKKMQNGTGSI
ncbi:d-isomer specific 2-hydroxyacid dehydrogenase, NAD binding domain-containing protein [Sarocladium implicatum]|nr:d-isomer specific 2-hydroxyacid dehydrogenase, NAD binding domain-containing protein [Sarocladium implicatum]